MNSKKYISITAILTAALFISTAVSALAITSSSTKIVQQNKITTVGQTTRVISLVGTVSAINGKSISLAAKQGTSSAGNKKATTTPATITFTVDASNASIFKNNATSSISSIIVGDTIVVQGAIGSDKNITAKIIRDYVMISNQVKPTLNSKQKQGATSTLTIKGNNQPITVGTVSSITGTTITIKNRNKNNALLSVDTANAKIIQKQGIISLSNVVVGDTLIVQGTTSTSKHYQQLHLRL